MPTQLAGDIYYAVCILLRKPPPCKQQRVEGEICTVFATGESIINGMYSLVAATATAEPKVHPATALRGLEGSAGFYVEGG